MKKMAFNVPDGYFDSLQGRLSEISRREVRSPFRRRMSLYMAAAAGLAAVIVAGGLLLHGSRSQDVSGQYAFYDELLYSDLIPVTDPEAVFIAAMQYGASDTEADWYDEYGDSYTDPYGQDQDLSDYDQDGADAYEYLIYSGISAEDVDLILSEGY